MKTTLKEVNEFTSKSKEVMISKIARLYAMGKIVDDEFLELNKLVKELSINLSALFSYFSNEDINQFREIEGIVNETTHVNIIKKKEKCLYCGELMNALNAKRRFCTDKCRVYFGRLSKKDQETLKSNYEK